MWNPSWHALINLFFSVVCLFLALLPCPNLEPHRQRNGNQRIYIYNDPLIKGGLQLRQCGASLELTCLVSIHSYSVLFFFILAFFVRDCRPKEESLSMVTFAAQLWTASSEMAVVTSIVTCYCCCCCLQCILTFFKAGDLEINVVLYYC